jgi:hypothetical protein
MDVSAVEACVGHVGVDGETHEDDVCENDVEDKERLPSGGHYADVEGEGDAMAVAEEGLVEEGVETAAEAGVAWEEAKK